MQFTAEPWQREPEPGLELWAQLGCVWLANFEKNGVLDIEYKLPSAVDYFDMNELAEDDNHEAVIVRTFFLVFFQFYKCDVCIVEISYEYLGTVSLGIRKKIAGQPNVPSHFCQFDFL